MPFPVPSCGPGLPGWRQSCLTWVPGGTGRGLLVLPSAVGRSPVSALPRLAPSQAERERAWGGGSPHGRWDHAHLDATEPGRVPVLGLGGAGFDPASLQPDRHLVSQVGPARMGSCLTGSWPTDPSDGLDTVSPAAKALSGSHTYLYLVVLCRGPGSLGMEGGDRSWTPVRGMSALRRPSRACFSGAAQGWPSGCWMRAALLPRSALWGSPVHSPCPGVPSFLQGT